MVVVVQVFTMSAMLVMFDTTVVVVIQVGLLRSKDGVRAQNNMTEERQIDEVILLLKRANNQQ